MKRENLPPSWVLRTHFSRAVYYRADSSIDASWLVDLPLKPLGRRNPAGKTTEKSKNAGNGVVYITPAPSLDGFLQETLQKAKEMMNEEDAISAQLEGEDDSFCFSNVYACTNSRSVWDSPPLNFTKDAWSFPSKGEEITEKPQSLQNVQVTNSGDSLSKPLLSRRSLSLNNLLKHHEEGCMAQIYTSAAPSSPETALDYDSRFDSPLHTSTGSESLLNSQTSSPRCNRNSTKSLTAPSANPSKGASTSPTKRDMTRALSWSEHLSNASGNERAVLSADNWMIDLSQLLLGERFASGMHSRIYRGLYQDSPLAVKIIRQPDEDELLAERLEKVFMQEVTMLSHLQHQNVVKFVAACKKPPVLCVITEYLPGGSLRAFLHKREGELLPIWDALHMALDIAYGMEYLHMKGVVHRDLKSENLVVGEDGCVKILDFGVSCFESDCNSDAHDLGTYRWMAPEMLSQKPYNRKVDVYSFGIVLWELLTCHLPYEEMGAVQAAFCVIHQNTRPPIPDDCPLLMRDLMCQCWSTEPEDRPEFWEVLRVLNLCMEDIPKS